ncbi:MAG: aminomethyl-transferring glycine dehydrogenase subunit GcvPB [bacterium]
MPESLLFELSSEGRCGYSLPRLDVPEIPLDKLIPVEYHRKNVAELPELSELDVFRHFVHLSTMNHHVDKGFYPLGSCTMKYNPKINENLARLDGFSSIHPTQEPKDARGAIRLMVELGEYLCAIAGMDGITLQPAAGAHGEMTGIKIIRAYHENRGRPRHKIILPDSAHGTNPASATISGYETVQIKSTEEGLVDIEDLKAHLNEDVAAFMLTNPNTLGLFESRVMEIAKLIHHAGALLYMDGANLNALLGIVRPGDIGFDVVHFNLHKTFSTPHGGGGPGSGPVGVKSYLADFLPVPILVRQENEFILEYDRPKSIGKLHAFYGNFGVMVKAYVYIRMLGSAGLRKMSENAILNANYLMRRLEKHYLLPHKQHAMHEFVLSGDWQKAKGAKTLDIAKRLLDYGFHAPTVYFPLIVHEALMVEPTETESKETLDAFADAMIAIAREVEENAERLHEAPTTTPVSRLDEGLAARNLDVKYVKGA